MSISRCIILSVFLYIFVGLFLYFYASKIAITIIFRLLNFAVLIVLAVILYRRILRPQAKELMHQQEQQREALTIYYDELIYKQHLLGVKLEEQEHLCRYLLEKIDQWCTSFDDWQRQYEQEREKVHLRAQQKAQQQAEWLAHERLYDCAIVDAVVQMRSDLQERFVQTDQQQQFMNELLNFMRKNVS